MLTEINHDTFCFNAQRVTALELDPRVRQAVFAQAALDRLTHWKDSARPSLPDSAFLKTGRIDSPAPPDVRRAMEDAVNTGTPLPALARTVERLLDRFRSGCAARAAAITCPVPAHSASANPFDAQTTRVAVLGRLEAIRIEALAAQAQFASAAATCLDRFNRFAGPAVPASETGRWNWVHAHYPAWLGPLLGAGAAAWMGQNTWTLATYAVIGAAVGIPLNYYRRLRPGQDQSPAGAVRPALDSLVAYANAKRAEFEHSYSAVRAAELIQAIETSSGSNLATIEISLKEIVAKVPDIPFVELRPGRVLLTGSALVRSLVESRRDRLDRIAPTAAASADAVMCAAADAVGPIDLADAIGLAANDPVTRPQLDYHLKHNLEILARSVITVRPGVNINRSLCPEFLSIGLPSGDKDPLVPLIRRTFPGAGIITGSSAGAIEIIFRAHNLTRGHLALHGRTSAAYENATALERSLWHFPRRVAALM